VQEPETSAVARIAHRVADDRATEIEPLPEEFVAAYANGRAATNETAPVGVR
jgi:hypothetical protein